MAAPTIFLSAGDPSGDNAAHRLVAELRENDIGLKCFGLGGPRLLAQGQEQLVDGTRLAVLGFWEVAKQFRFFRDLMKLSVNEIERRRPDCVVLVDYPGFNLRLAERIKHLGIPIIYYISPQIWAWGGRRIDQIKRLVDLVLLILPFETDLYDQAGVANEFVGHYLIEDIPDEMVGSGPPAGGHLALLPGSRPQEIQRHLGPMLGAAVEFCRRHETTAVIAGVRGAHDYESAIASTGSSAIEMIYDDSRKVIGEARLVLTSSGTATLEAAIIARPMVVIYKTGWITYQIARRLVRLDKIALANLVLDDKVVPELIQSKANSRAMLAELERYVEDREYYDRVAARLRETSALLGGPGASARAARRIGQFLSG